MLTYTPAAKKTAIHPFQYTRRRRLRRLRLRQTLAATEFDKASRTDLADKERQESLLLQSLLPPLLPTSNIDQTLQQVFKEEGIIPGEGDPKRTLGKVLKGFYAKVDRSVVDPEVVKRRAEALLSSS